MKKKFQAMTIRVELFWEKGKEPEREIEAELIHTIRVIQFLPHYQDLFFL